MRSCRSLRRRTTSSRPGGPIRVGGPPRLSETLLPDLRSPGSGRQTAGSTAARKIWKQLRREAIPVARCTLARLMGELGVRGVLRTTRSNQLWVSDFTQLATWRGVVCFAFVIDVDAQRSGARCPGAGALRPLVGRALGAP